MHTNATVGRTVWPYVAIGNFLFVYPGQSVRIVIVCVRVKLAQESGNVFVEFGKPGFPSKRHNDMLVDKRRVRYNPGFFVGTLIKRDGQCADFLFNRLFVLGTAIVGFDPHFLRFLFIDHPGNGYGRNIRGFVCVNHIRNQSEQQRFEPLCMLIPRRVFRTEYVIRCGKQIIVPLIGHVNITSGTDVLAPIRFFNPRFERLVQFALCIARVPLIQTLETHRVNGLYTQQAFQ